MIVPSIKVAKIYKMLEIDTTIISSYLNSTTKYKSLFVIKSQERDDIVYLSNKT